MINPYTDNTWFVMDQLEPQVSFAISNLEVGEVSNAIPMKTEDGQDAFRLLLVKARTEAHKANLEDDYDLIQQMALADKKNKKVLEWVNKNIKNAYIYIADDFKDCNFIYDWIQDNNN